MPALAALAQLIEAQAFSKAGCGTVVLLKAPEVVAASLTRTPIAGKTIQHLLKLAVVAMAAVVVPFCKLYKLAGILGKLAASAAAASLPAWLRPGRAERIPS